MNLSSIFMNSAPDVCTLLLSPPKPLSSLQLTNPQSSKPPQQKYYPHICLLLHKWYSEKIKTTPEEIAR